MNNSDGFYFKKQFKINLHFMKLNKKEGFFMTEKEKVKNGLLYNPNKDQELITERNSCKDKCYEYNKIQPTKLKARELKIKDIVIGAGSVVNKDIPSNSVAVGNPCIVKKQLK